MRSGWSLRAAKSVSSDKNVVNVGRTSDSERRLDLDDSDGISGIKISATTLCDCTYMEVWPKDTLDSVMPISLNISSGTSLHYPHNRFLASKLGARETKLM